MAQFFSTIGRHLECAIQTELVVELELALIERKRKGAFKGGREGGVFMVDESTFSRPCHGSGVEEAGQN